MDKVTSGMARQMHPGAQLWLRIFQEAHSPSWISMLAEWTFPEQGDPMSCGMLVVMVWCLELPNPTGCGTSYVLHLVHVPTPWLEFMEGEFTFFDFEEDSPMLMGLLPCLLTRTQWVPMGLVPSAPDLDVIVEATLLADSSQYIPADFSQRFPSLGLSEVLWPAPWCYFWRKRAWPSKLCLGKNKQTCTWI